MFTGRIKNEYGAIVDQAVFVIDDAKLYEKEAVTTIKCTHFKFDADNPNNHKAEVLEEEVENESVPSHIEYVTKYYHNGVARQQGFKPYILEHKDERYISFDMTEEYAELYDRVNGTREAKIMHVCEHHLKREIIPKHQ